MNSSLALLGLGEGFSSSELHSAYRAHVRLVHPDLATSDADRVRRTQATIRLNLAYAELRNAPARRTPAPVVKTNAHVGITTTTLVSFEWSRDTLYALVGAIVAGTSASTITGQMPLTVGVMLVVVLVARSGHGHPDQNLRRGPA
jgi:hypothetical protein